MTQSAPNESEVLLGYVINLQHFSTHDGPGIRTTVFLKGCSLRCKWCCNPEAITTKPELAFNVKKCIGEQECGRCLSSCPEQALQVQLPDGKVRVNWDLCSNCGRCVQACPSQALYNYGKTMSVEEVLTEVEQDGGFYGESGGGITLSGGECLMQPEFSAELLKIARARGLHTAIETAGNVPWSFMAQVLPYVDTMLHDYKLSDTKLHKHWTGADNSRIVENFQRAYANFPHIDFIARIPLVPGANDDDSHIAAVLEKVLPWPNVSMLELMPYHHYGNSKYDFLGRRNTEKEFSPPTSERLSALRKHISEQFAKRRHSSSMGKN